MKNHFAIDFFEGELFFERGIRVANKDVRKCNIKGWRGYAACDGGFNPTNAFIQNFGHLAKKNVLNLKKEEALAFAEGKALKINLGKKPKHVIVKYRGFPLGAAYYDGVKIVSKLPQKKRRKIINELVLDFERCKKI